MSMDIIVSNAPAEVSTYQAGIRAAGEKLVEIGNIDPAYIAACIDREVDFPTGLLLANGEGIAIPHGNSDLVKKDSISVVRLEKAVAFGRMEDKDLTVGCSLIFNLALASGAQHISILRKLIGQFQDDEFVKTCQTAEQNEVQAYITKKLAE